MPASPHLALQHTMLLLHLSLSPISCSERQDLQALMKLLLKLTRSGTRSTYREWFARAAPYLLSETTQKSLLHWQFPSSALIFTQVRNIFCFLLDLTVINTTASTSHLTLYDLARRERAKITVSLQALSAHKSFYIKPFLISQEGLSKHCSHAYLARPTDRDFIFSLHLYRGQKSWIENAGPFSFPAAVGGTVIVLIELSNDPIATFYDYFLES